MNSVCGVVFVSKILCSDIISVSFNKKKIIIWPQ